MGESFGLTHLAPFCCCVTWRRSSAPELRVLGAQNSEWVSLTGDSTEGLKGLTSVLPMCFMGDRNCLKVDFNMTFPRDVRILSMCYAVRLVVDVERLRRLYGAIGRVQVQKRYCLHDCMTLQLDVTIRFSNI